MSMENRSMGILTLLVPSAVCAVALIVGYKAQSSTRDNNQRLAALQTEIGGLEQQLASLSNSLAVIGRRPAAVVSGSGSGNDGDVDSLLALESSVSRIEKTLDKTGLDGLIASNSAVDPTVLGELVDEFSLRKQIETARETNQKKFEDQRTMDLAKYGPELTNMYAQLRGDFGQGGRGNRGNQGQDQQQMTDEQRQAARDKREQERATALKEFQDKYPDSYYAATAVAESAMGAMFSRDIAKVEQTYNQLSSMKQSADLVNDWGVQVVPTIEYYLANQYIEQNKYSEANKILDKLEKNSPNALIPTMMGGRGGRGGRGGDHGPGFQPVSRVTSALREKMQPK